MNLNLIKVYFACFVLRQWSRQRSQIWGVSNVHPGQNSGTTTQDTLWKYHAIHRGRDVCRV